VSQVLDEIRAANSAYAENFGEKGSLPVSPLRGIAILTCMDSRLNPYDFLGLREGDAHIIRNAGGRASDDAIRSLVISHKLLGTREWFVIHHTGCGMESFTNEIMHDLLSGSLETAVQDETGWHNQTEGDGSTAGQYINWLTIYNQPQSVIDDVRRIREHPLVPQSIAIYGFLFDVKTGRLIEIPEATAIGQRPVELER